MSAALLGIDLGTSSVKALIIDAGDGRILGQGNAPYPIERPEPGAAEQSPESWWVATCDAVRQAISEAGAISIARKTSLQGGLTWTDAVLSPEALLQPQLSRSSQLSPRTLIPLTLSRSSMRSRRAVRPTWSRALWLQRWSPS